MSAVPEITMYVGQNSNGFEVKDVTPLEALRSVAYQLEHKQSGARLLHLYNQDAENLFSVSFPTPPPDDTGIPHILEHAVLAGSGKYPVKEPFFEMIKMSMATFINAMTGSDCTYYPVASNVKQDLFNLAEVYFDAVFHPLLTEQTFRREGHHFAPSDPENPTGDLTITGIVYNEMKGAFSDPESRLYRSISRELLPDTIYGKESGGDPEAIPDLTYEALKEFHSTYYHPSNSYFFLYGNIPTTEYLAFLSDKLNSFNRLDVDASITPQVRWNQPRSTVDTYPIGEDEPSTEKTYMVIKWLIGDATDAEDVALLYILSLILLGNEAAPLKKAIITSNLGADIIASGAGGIGRESTFSVGLKGSEPDHLDDFVQLITETLSQIAESEIDPERVEAAFQQSAYHYLEIQSMFPLHMMDRVISSWIYDKNPLIFLRMSEHLSNCKRRYESDPQLFNQLIRSRLLANSHRLTAMLKPDGQMQSRIDMAFTERMKKTRTQFTDDQVKQIAEDAEELDRLNSQPNSPELLETLPQLKVSDLPDQLTHIQSDIEVIDGVKLLRNNVFSNGVNYLVLNFNLKGMPSGLWPYLPRYTEAIRKMGAAGMDYEQIAQRSAASTGGISCWTDFGTRVDDANHSLWNIQFSLKALDDQMSSALEVLHDLLFSIEPNDKNRLQDVLVQAQARYRTDMVYDGSGTAMSHAARGLTPEGYLAEMVYGLPQLTLVEGFNKNFDTCSEDIVCQIESIRDFLPVRGRLTASFTGSDNSATIVQNTLKNWISDMRHESIGDTSIGFTPYDVPPSEGLAGPIQVAHCAQVIPAPHYSHSDKTALTVGAHLVRLDYIMNEIRFRGNAYGAMFNYSPLGSVLSLGSYRDPHISRTLDVFSGVADYIREVPWTQTDIDHAIIATAKQFERPIRPAAATGQALQRYLIGQTPELREQHYSQLRHVTPKEVKRALLEVLEANFTKGAVCVVSSREKLEAANQEMSGRQLTIEDILG